MSVNTVQNDGSLLRVAGGTLWADSPIGTILPYGGTSAPSGWMICDGTSLLRASYPELFAVIGTAFGSVDSTHFNIPDLREATTKGIGENPNGEAHVKSGGLSLGEFQDDRVEVRANTNFAIVTNQSTGRGFSGNPMAWGDTFKGRIGDTTEVKSVGVNYIIKAKMVAVPSDFLAKVDEAVGKFLNHRSSNIGVTFSSSATVSKDVTFSTPMPDTNYVVIFEGTFGNEQTLYPIITAKSVNGFTVKVTKTDETTTGTYALKYHAFRIA